MIFYRVCNTKTQQGLWYNFNGTFTGKIHDEFNFCVNNSLEMDFDHDLVGWLSATNSFETLLEWFPLEDIKQLQVYGYYIHIYKSSEFKFYDRFKHHIIKQDSIKLVNILNII